MGDLEFFSFKNNGTMNRSKNSKTPVTRFEVHQINTAVKSRHSDSPTSSILKTPTAIFVTSRSSSAKTKKLKFANGPVDLLTLRNGSHESSVSTDSSTDIAEDRKLFNNGEVILDENVIEVAVSPVKKMQVSPDSWKAFLEYKKYSDYPNETEKTDYTYSRLSKYRHKEIIPGFLIRPNLSRSPIGSRRSSFSLQGSQSMLNESYLSKYDFKVNSQPLTEVNYSFEYKIPNQSSTVSRSKYYLRSASFDDADINEVSANPFYYEKEYGNNSETESVYKSKSHSTSGIADDASHYSSKLRSLEVEDEDMDEVDPPHYGKQQYSWSNAIGDRAKGSWSQQGPQTVSQYFSNFFTTIFLYLTSVGTVTKDLFSKHILRRPDHMSQYSSTRSWRRENLGYTTAGGSWVPWSNEKPYSSSMYYSDRGTWYQRLFYYFNEKFSNITNLLWGDNRKYVSSRHYETSKRRKYWWFLIPFLLLAGLWLFKAEQDSGFVSNKYKDLDCMTNGLFTSFENAIKPVWRSGYFTYQRASNSLSCYVNDSWERVKLPFTHIGDWLYSKMSGLSGSSFGFVFNFVNVLWQGLCTILNLFHDAFSNVWMFLFDFFTDFLSAVNNVLHYIYKFFTDGVFNIGYGIAWILGNAWKFLVNGLLGLKSFLYLLAPKDDIPYHYEVPAVSKQECVMQQKSDASVIADAEEFKNIMRNLTAIREKVNDLELEFRKEKESRKNNDDFYSRQLEQNSKTLQKYQATLNHAMMSSKRPAHLSSSSIQYFLDNQSDALKQWITQNFLLKTDSPHIDENQIAFLIAKYSNRTGEDLLALKKEFGKFIISHKSELESLRKEFNAMGATNVGGGDVSLAFIKKLIADAIKLYDADKTGRVDYALESAGGHVQSIRCTETYITSPQSYILLGWAVYTKASSPRDAITPGTAAGQCWAFIGSQGFLVLHLSHTIKVTGFTMEHISRLLVPKGHIESAPKNFSMWGLKHEHDVEPYLFGEYTYLDNEETLQYFPVTNPTSEPYNMVELKITSNHGNPNYTCLYRIRVHGDLHSVQLYH